MIKNNKFENWLWEQAKEKKLIITGAVDKNYITYRFYSRDDKKLVFEYVIEK